MEPALTDFLCRRYGAAQMACIAQRWRANFGLAEGAGPAPGHRHQEYDDLVALLMEHARDASEEVGAVARWLAFSCMGENHLWEDLGLPERMELTRLMSECFPRLRALNSQNMRWKKFFYKQLCNKAEVFACRAPSCDLCSEYRLCFEATAPQRPGWEPPYAVAIAAIGERWQAPS